VSADELDQWTLTDTDKTTSLRVGWHDDNFCVGTYDAQNNLDWYFEPKLAARDALQRYAIVMIGGELQPSIQSQVFTPGYTGQPFAAAVNATHASWLLNHFAFETDADTARVASTKQGALLLGYAFRVSSVVARLPVTRTCGATRCVELVVTLENHGTAPFYYDLQLMARIGASGGSTAAETELVGTMPGANQVADFAAQLAVNSSSSSSSGALDVTLRLTSSMLLAARAHIVFANTIAQASGELSVTMSNALPCTSIAGPTYAAPPAVTSSLSSSSSSIVMMIALMASTTAFFA
jgi:hypothetical protein